MNFVDSPTLRKLPRRSDIVKAVIVHTTGDTDLEKILRFYHDPDGFQPHYMIDYQGTVHRIVTEDKEAYHAAHYRDEIAAYAKGFNHWATLRWNADQKNTVSNGCLYSGYLPWRKSWPELASPLSMVTSVSVNACTVGVELQQTTDAMKTPDIFLDDQYEALSELLVDICQRNKVPVDRPHVLGHYDVSPMCRSTSHGGWDPGDAFNWNRLFELCTQVQKKAVCQ